MGLQRTAGRLTDPRAGRAAMTADATSHKSMILIEVTCVRYLKDDLSRFAKAGSASASDPPLLCHAAIMKRCLLSRASHTRIAKHVGPAQREQHTPERGTQIGTHTQAHRSPRRDPRHGRVQPALSLSLSHASLSSSSSWPSRWQSTVQPAPPREEYSRLRICTLTCVACSGGSSSRWWPSADLLGARPTRRPLSSPVVTLHTWSFLALVGLSSNSLQIWHTRGRRLDGRAAHWSARGRPWRVLRTWYGVGSPGGVQRLDELHRSQLARHSPRPEASQRNFQWGQRGAAPRTCARAGRGGEVARPSPPHVSREHAPRPHLHRRLTPRAQARAVPPTTCLPR